MKVGRRKITQEQEVGSPSVSMDGLGLSTPERPSQNFVSEREIILCFFPVLPRKHMPSLVQYSAEVTTPKNHC